MLLKITEDNNDEPRNAAEGQSISPEPPRLELPGPSSDVDLLRTSQIPSCSGEEAKSREIEEGVIRKSTKIGKCRGDERGRFGDGGRLNVMKSGVGTS